VLDVQRKGSRRSDALYTMIPGVSHLDTRLIRTSWRWWVDKVCMQLKMMVCKVAVSRELFARLSPTGYHTSFHHQSSAPCSIQSCHMQCSQITYAFKLLRLIFPRSTGAAKVNAQDDQLHDSVHIRNFHSESIMGKHPTSLIGPTGVVLPLSRCHREAVAKVAMKASAPSSSHGLVDVPGLHYVMARCGCNALKLLYRASLAASERNICSGIQQKLASSEFRSLSPRRLKLNPGEIGDC